MSYWIFFIAEISKTQAQKGPYSHLAITINTFDIWISILIFAYILYIFSTCTGSYERNVLEFAEATGLLSDLHGIKNVEKYHSGGISVVS